MRLPIGVASLHFLDMRIKFGTVRNMLSPNVVVYVDRDCDSNVALRNLCRATMISFDHLLIG